IAGNEASARRKRTPSARRQEPLHHGFAGVQAVPLGSYELTPGSVAEQPGSGKPRSPEQDLHAIDGRNGNADDRSRSGGRRFQISPPVATAEIGNAVKGHAGSVRAKLSGRSQAAQ